MSWQASSVIGVHILLYRAHEHWTDERYHPRQSRVDGYLHNLTVFTAHALERYINFCNYHVIRFSEGIAFILTATDESILSILDPEKNSTTLSKISTFREKVQADPGLPGEIGYILTGIMSRRFSGFVFHVEPEDERMTFEILRACFKSMETPIMQIYGALERLFSVDSLEAMLSAFECWNERLKSALVGRAHCETKEALEEYDAEMAAANLISPDVPFLSECRFLQKMSRVFMVCFALMKNLVKIVLPGHAFRLAGEMDPFPDFNEKILFRFLISVCRVFCEQMPKDPIVHIPLQEIIHETVLEEYGDHPTAGLLASFISLCMSMPVAVDMHTVLTYGGVEPCLFTGSLRIVAVGA